VRRELAADLDTIVLMAMRKEPERRYATARQLADDIESHLEHRPIAAHADTWVYRAGKFLRRHAWGVAATFGVVLIVGGLVAFYTVQLSLERDRLARASATAEEVSAFLVGLFEDANPSLTRPDVTARRGFSAARARSRLPSWRSPRRSGDRGIPICAHRSPGWRKC
jgi:serine/threonine-protein kinase